MEFELQLIISLRNSCLFYWRHYSEIIVKIIRNMVKLGEGMLFDDAEVTIQLFGMSKALRGLGT